ncbi:alkaline shock response membrane anchor protein AmaP [Crossiella sp. CA-258035]|uniref:alkaline shock response membrane anchor protein AmaP n=1 Tax=Crossiella sp. CA-258035 TaxID=2981138 RepID=UPI0024BBF263|nr:alkaline shock response membrane anchor protein AmaP [Crossiella sp. CA-258035]WHT21570.1 alkaline shock response membrane anchor protein AmaP [Crossiella sp. CA-258035]
MSTRSTAAVARSARAERVLTGGAGVLAMLLGAGALVLGSGWLGAGRAARPVLDPMIRDWLLAHRPWVLGVGIALGLLVLVLGLRWVVRSLRPETRPDLRLDGFGRSRVMITSSAFAEAVRADAAGVDGVSRAHARLVGSVERPALRLSLWLAEGTDVRAVWQQLDETVLSRARACLGVETLPTAVRLELDSARRQRVR